MYEVLTPSIILNGYSLGSFEHYRVYRVNPLPTIGNSLKKQKSLYKVLTPSIKPPYKFLWAYGSS